MHLPDENMDFGSEQTPTSEELPKPIDFTVDSAGNVSPKTRERAARMGERKPPECDQWRRSG